MPTEGGAGFRRALGVRDFRLLVTAFLIDAVGGWAYNVVLIVYVFQRTDSPAWIAAVTASSWVPRLLAAPHAGALADRFARRRVMVVSALVAFAFMCAMTAAVAVDAPVLLVLLLSSLVALSTTPYRPAASGLLPDAVGERDLVAANGLFGTVESLVVVVGPALGGLLLLTGEPAWGMAVNAATFLVAAAVVSRIRTDSRAERSELVRGVTAQVLDGLRALRADRTAVVLVAFCALDSGVYGASTVVFVPVAEQVGLGAKGYSLLLGAFALGGVLVAGAVDRMSASTRSSVLIVGGMWTLALPFAATAFVEQPAVALALQVVAGGGMVVVDVLAVTALQRGLPREVLGRVFGLLDAATIAAMVVASVLTSLLLRTASLRTTLLVVGLTFAGLTVLGLPALARAEARTAAAARALAPRVEGLRDLDLFDGASRTALEALAADVQVVELADGAVLLQEGDPADALYVLRAGRLAVTTGDAAGREVLLRTQQSGSYVGEIGLLHGAPRSATVRADGPVTVWRVSAEAFRAALEGSAPSAALLSEAGRRARRSAEVQGPAPRAASR